MGTIFITWELMSWWWSGHWRGAPGWWVWPCGEHIAVPCSSAVGDSLSTKRGSFSFPLRLFCATRLWVFRAGLDSLCSLCVIYLKFINAHALFSHTGYPEVKWSLTLSKSNVFCVVQFSFDTVYPHNPTGSQFSFLWPWISLSSIHQLISKLVDK